MIVRLRMPLTDEGDVLVELAAIPRVGETVELGDGPWTVRHVVHYPSPPGAKVDPPYVVLHSTGGGR